MVQIFLPIAAVLTGLLLFQLGNGLMGTLLSVRLNLEGYTTEVAGLVASSYHVGLMGGAILANRVIAMVGHIRAYASFAAVYAAAVLLMPIFGDPASWYGLRFLGGFCVAGMFMVIESWLNASVGNKSRGRVLSLYMIVVYSGLGGGQFLLQLDDPLRFTLFSVTAIFFILSLVPISLTQWPAPPPPKAEFLNFLRLYRISPLALVGSFAAGLVLSAFYGLTPIFAQNSGLDIDQVAFLMGVAILGGLAVQWPVGWISDRYDRRTVITGCLFTVAVASVAIAATTFRPSPAIYVLAGLFYCLSFAIYPLSLGQMNDHVGDEDRVPAIGGILLVYSLGAALGPIPAAALMTALGDAALFGYTAAVAGLTGAFALYRMTRRSPVPLEEQGPYVHMPRTTPAAGELGTEDAAEAAAAALAEAEAESGPA